MSAKAGPGAGRPSVEGLPVAWRRQAKTFRRYGGQTPAVALDRYAADFEATLRERDETTLSVVEAAKESGYSADHLGRLGRDGKIPNAGRPGAPRIARRHRPRNAAVEKSCLAAKEPLGEVSSWQIVESVIQRGIE